MDIREMNGHVPENIAAIIERKGLKKKAVAEKAGLTAQDFSQIMGGRRLMKISEMIAFMEALDAQPNEIMGYSADHPARPGCGG